ncbi:MAG: AAA family ATPase [Candidatus Izemoplasmataceae bacterium]
MLKRFSVKNYKNFKDKIELDLSNKKDYKFNSNVIKNDLLTKIGIFGANGSGKTNFGLALFDIVLHLVDKENQKIQYNFYLNADSDESYAEFTYIFLFNDDTIQYTYKKLDAKTLIYEELFLNEKKVFSYNLKSGKKDLANMHLIEAENLNYTLKDKTISMVRYIANNGALSDKSTFMKMMKFISNMLWFRSIGFNAYIGYMRGPEELTSSIINNGLVEKFNKFLIQCKLNYNLFVATDPTGNKILMNKYQQRDLPFWQTASNGTHALTLFFYWKHKFKDIPFIFIDEFDAFFHYELAETLIRELSKQKDIQIIFTSHNTSLLKNSILRPDCYFTIQDNNLTSFVNKTEREIREAHNLEKLYRQGEFRD